MFVCYNALPPWSTAKLKSEQSIILITLLLGKTVEAEYLYKAYIFHQNTEKCLDRQHLLFQAVNKDIFCEAFLFWSTVD